MADPNLDEFLRQAAQRRKQRQNSTRLSDRPDQFSRKSKSDVVEAEVVEADVVSPGAPLSRQKFGTRVHLHVPDSNHLAEDIDDRDDRMEDHLHQVFDHKLGSLSSSSQTPSQFRAAKPKKKKSNQRDPLMDVTNTTTNVQRAIENEVGAELQQMLRNKNRLKVAFIINEIFTRKF